MGFPIQWLEAEERFDWTSPIPLDETAKTRLIYIQELLSAVAYRNNELGKDYQLPPFYYHEKFRKWFYEEIQEEIDKLVVDFGFASVESPELLGRPWSDLPQQTHKGQIKYGWDYQLLQDFRDVLDKLKLYGNIYVTDANPNLRVISMSRIDGDLKFIKSFAVSQYSAIKAVDREYAYGTDELAIPNRTWKKDRSTWTTITTRINTTYVTDMCVDEHYLYQMRLSVIEVLNKGDLSLINSKNLVDYTTCSPSPPGICQYHQFVDIACDSDHIYMLGRTRDLDYSTLVMKIYKIRKSDLSLTNYFSIAPGFDTFPYQLVRGGLCVDDKYLYTSVVKWSVSSGYSYWLQKYNKLTGILVAEIPIDMRCYTISCDDKYIYTGRETFISPNQWPLRMRNKDLSLVKTVEEMDEVKILFSGSGICTEFEYLNAK